MDAESQPLMQSLTRALHGDHPVELLQAVSGLMATTEPRPSLQDSGPAFDLTHLVETFEDVDLAATTAALHVIAALTPDEVLAARIRRTLSARTRSMPRWLGSLDDTEVAEVWEMRHVQRDGEEYFLDVRLPDGFTMTALVYVDNNMGGVVKDAFVSDRRLSYIRGNAPHLVEPDPDMTWTSWDLADARALLEQAVDHGAMIYPPIETDSWPMSRPLVRWVLRALPEGGRVPEVREWSEGEQQELVERFLASPQGKPYDDADHRSLLEDLVWFGVSQGTGDPLRWSEVNVEVLLADWFPRKVVADADLLTKLPALLRAFIRFSHAEQGLRRELTDETLASVTRWEGEYQRLIRTPRAQGAEALARMLLDDDLPRWEPVDALVGAVGSREALEGLDEQPLPDEAFDWSVVPEEIRPKVEEILAMCDENAVEMLDVEHRTANRRLLARVVAADPAYFRGRAAARTSAAAISYMVAHANDSLSMYGPLTAGELLEPFGVKSASQRAKQFRHALGLPEHFPGGPMALGAPDLLVGARRAELMEAYARYA